MSPAPAPTPADPEAHALFARGLESLTSLRSVRYTQRLGDGGGSLYRSQTAVSAADAERPAAYADTIVDAAGNVVAQQVSSATAVGSWSGGLGLRRANPLLHPRRVGGGATSTPPVSSLGRARRSNGELSQVVTFWQPPRASPSRAPPGSPGGSGSPAARCGVRRWSPPGTTWFTATATSTRRSASLPTHRPSQRRQSLQPLRHRHPWPRQPHLHRRYVEASRHSGRHSRPLRQGEVSFQNGNLVVFRIRSPTRSCNLQFARGSITTRSLWRCTRNDRCPKYA